jgi:hypothetical protein
MAQVAHSTARKAHPAPGDFPDYVAVEPEFRYTGKYLDGDDTNTYLLPSEESDLQREIHALAQKLAALTASPAFNRLGRYDRARPFVLAAQEFLEGPPPMPKGMTEEEYAFAIEVGKAVTARWPKGGMGRGYRPAHFIRDQFGGERGFLRDPLFCLASLSVIDPYLYKAYVSSVRPERLIRNPEDDLGLRGQGARSSKSGGKRPPMAPLAIRSEAEILSKLPEEDREQLRALAGKRSRGTFRKNQHRYVLPPRR